MNTKELLMKEIGEVPEPFLTQVLDYVQFIKSKIAHEKMDFAVMSESSLEKDWLKPEEDKAWQDL